MFGIDYLQKSYLKFWIIENISLDDIERLTTTACEQGYFNMDESSRVMSKKGIGLKKEQFLSVLDFKEYNEFFKILKVVCLKKYQNENFQNPVNTAWEILKEKIIDSFEYIYSFKPLNIDELGPVKVDQIITAVKMVKKNVSFTLESENNSVNIYENFYKLFEKKFNTILIMGNPGVGKSIHVKHLVYTNHNRQWKILNDKIILVVLLKNVRENDDIYEVIYEQNFKKLNIPFIENSELLINVVKEKPEKFLLFIDGVDEYNFQEESILNIIRGEKFSIKTVLWSRKHAVEKYITNYDYIFEILGLKGNQIITFYKKYINDNRKLNSFLRILQNGNVNRLEKLCQIPLLALVVYLVWNKHKDNIKLNTSYQFFVEFIKITQEQNNFDGKRDKNIFDEIKKLCFEEMNKNSIIVSVKKGKKFEKCNCLNGLTEFIYMKSECRIQFYHLLIQEFLAAEYLIKYLKPRWFKRRRLLKNDDMIKDKNPSRLVRIFQFIQEYDKNFFQNLCEDSLHLKNMFNITESVQRQIRNIEKSNFVLNIQDEIIVDSSLKNFCYQIENIRKINFQNVSISFLLFIESLIEAGCKALNSLRYLKNNETILSNSYSFYEHDFTKVFLKLIDKTLIEFLQINQTKYKISRSGGEQDYSMEEIRMSDNHSDIENIVNIDVKYGSNSLRLFEDYCSRNFRTVNEDILTNAKLCYIDQIILENKIFDCEKSKIFFEKITEFNNIFVKNCLLKELNKDQLEKCHSNFYRKITSIILIQGNTLMAYSALSKQPILDIT